MNDWNETAFMPAEAATEVGADEPLSDGETAVLWLMVAANFGVLAGLVAWIWEWL